jgi:cobalt-zinc-cadmium efflux system outer membrane protein
MKPKILSCLILPVCLALRVAGEPLQHATGMTSTNILSLDAVVSEVLSNNSSLKAARANWEAMKERIPQARAWEDPRAGVDATAGRFVNVPANSFSDQKFMLEQTLPISGRNRLRGSVASAEAVNAFEEFHRRELDAVAKASTAYYRLANAYAQLELNHKNTVLLKQFAEISRTKYEVGIHSQADVLSAETELTRLEETAFDFQRHISEAQTQLNTLMDRPPQAPLGNPSNTAFQPVNFSLEKLQELALGHRPELLMAAKKIEAAQARLNAAHKEWIPEPSLRVEADRYNGASQAISEVSAGFSINLPWFNRGKYKAGIRENQKLVEGAQHELAATRIETMGMIRDQFRKLESFHHHTELSKTKLLPLAAQTVSSKRLGYETDKANFLELLTAQQTVQEIESMYWNHLTDYQMALAEMEALIGTSLESAISASEHQHDSK